MDLDHRERFVCRSRRLGLETQGMAVKWRVAVVGAGVSGLTSAVLFAERGYDVSIFAEQIGQSTTSGAAAALWFPYDCEPADKVIAWALTTYKMLVDLSRDHLRSGVAMIELRQFSRTGKIPIPDWAHSLGASVMSSARRAVAQRRREVETSLAVFPPAFKSGFAITVPLMDTTIYLDYLANRFIKAGGVINGSVRFDALEDVDARFDLVINCTGIGARFLAHDLALEPHRGQVAIVPKIDNLKCAIVCDDAPLMYAIPRTNDCVFGGTNEISDNFDPNPISTSRMVAECIRVLKIDQPRILAQRVGLRPFRKSGVRLEREQLPDGRTIIHNYGHGGSGFTLSWGCAENVFDLANR
jgi:D-amino-acid oxidase